MQFGELKGRVFNNYEVVELQRIVSVHTPFRLRFYEGAAQRNIKFNITVRCTFNLDVADFCYKYYGALHLKFL